MAATHMLRQFMENGCKFLRELILEPLTEYDSKQFQESQVVVTDLQRRDNMSSSLVEVHEQE